MALFVFSWTKREYIMTLLSLILLAITASHREFFLCRETALNRVEKFGVWLGVMDKPEPCPGTEDLHSMALELGASTLGVIGATYAVPWLWKRAKSMIGHGVKQVMDRLQYVKDCWYHAWHIPGLTADDESDDEYYSPASDIVLASDRDLTEDRDPTRDRGPPEDRGPTPVIGSTSYIDFPSPADIAGGGFESTKDGSSKSQYQILHKAYERKRVILFVKQNEEYTQIFAYSPVTRKFVLKSYFPSKPRFGVPGWYSKISEFRN